MRHLVRHLAALCLALALPAAAAAQTPYTTWYLAEGSTGFFEEEILIANPGTSPATVTIQYLVPAGATAPAPKQITVGATTRATVKVNDDITLHAVSAVVTSDIPIVVERSMYWGGTNRLGGHNTFAVPAPQMEWFLAEGVSNAIFDQYILVSNPNGVPVDVQVEYLGFDGIVDVDTYTVAANSRRTTNVLVDLDSPFGGRFRNRAFSARVKSLTSGAPIIVERSIYWGGIFAAGLNPGGTNESGITTLRDTWRFAEGMAGGTFQTFILLANPNATEAVVDTTFYLEDGSTTVDTRTVPANSRANIWVNAEVGAANRNSFSALVRARDGALIAAERAVYWGNLREGHVVAGIAAESNVWGFAEGIEDRFNGVDYDTYFLLNNAGANAATVTATFFFEDGTGFTDTFDIAATSRYTLIAERYPQLSNRRFSAFFSSTQPIVAERAVYWGTGYWGGHASSGLALPTSFTIGTPAPASAPAVTAIAPATGSTAGGTTVTITGNNFGMKSTVKFGDKDATSVVVNGATSILARTPAGTQSSSVPVTVTFNGQTGTSPTNFLYNSPTAAAGASAARFCEVAEPKAGAPSTAIFRTMCTGATITAVLPLNYEGVVSQVAAERRGDMINSCVKTGGNLNFVTAVIARLRQTTATNRWGYNVKRGGQGISDDIITYFYGPEGEEMEGDLRVYIIDILGNHCPIAGVPSPSWQDQTVATRNGGTVGRWTANGVKF